MIRQSIIFSSMILSLAAPAAAGAATELFFQGPASARPGEPVTVLLQARLGEPINALATTVRFNPERAVIAGADDIGSVVRYWLSRPAPSASGSLALEGIIPGGVGPGFTDTVLIARLSVVPEGTGAVTLSLADTVIFQNQPTASQGTVTVQPFVMRVSADAPIATVSADTSMPSGESVVRVYRDPLVNDGDWTLALDIRGDGGSVETGRIRERRFGLFGAWRDVANGDRLSDQTRTSILEVAVAERSGQRIVARIIPLRLKVAWVILAGLILGASAMAMRGRSGI